MFVSAGAVSLNEFIIASYVFIIAFITPQWWWGWGGEAPPRESLGN